jgi:CheY-like chemotaxis protein
MAEGARVLVVDDSPTIRKIVSGVLTRAGFEVSSAGDGAQALVALKKDKYALALVDFVMPRLNGFELCKKLRDDPDLKELPVVLMSVKADKIREHFLRQTGAIDAITKPFDPRALVLTIEAALQRAEDGKGRRSSGDSLPPTSGVLETTETTLNDPYATPASVRPPVPETFVRRLSETFARLNTDPSSEREPVSMASAIRRMLGDDGLSMLYADLVGPVARAVLAGDLGAIPLAEVLQLLQLQRQTGVLTIFNQSTEVQVSMRDGLIDLATSRGAADEFRLGRYVIEGGKLDRAQLDTLIAKERASGRARLLGDALVAEGIITDKDLEAALSRQTSELIYDVLRWTRGRFVFDQKATKAEAASAQLGLPVASIVMEGFRRVDEWRLMEGVLGDFEASFYRDPGAIEAMGTARLSREERIVLMAVDGERTVRDLIGAVQMGSFDVCKILYQLVQSRLVRRRVG